MGTDTSEVRSRLDGTRVTTGGTDESLVDWWVRLALTDSRARHQLTFLFDVDADTDLMDVFPTLSPEARAGVFTVAQGVTGRLMPANVLGVSPELLEQASGAAAHELV